MTNSTWTWIVSYGTARKSVCVERDGNAAARKFKAAHYRFEIIKRPAGYHWDGGKL